MEKPTLVITRNLSALDYFPIIVSKGKVRENRTEETRKTFLSIAGDNISAFDQELGVSFADKGTLLTQMSKANMLADAHICPMAIITGDIYGEVRYDDDVTVTTRQKLVIPPNCTVMKYLRMIPVEFVIRAYLVGSAWRAYLNGNRVLCGIKLPDGMVESQKFKEPLFTPTTKAPKGQHDENITFEQFVQILEREGFGDRKMAEDIRDTCIKLFLHRSKKLEKVGILAIDTKFEIGVDENGKFYIADEYFTPDSSRFTKKSDYVLGKPLVSLDKEDIRRYVATHPGKKIPQTVLKGVRKNYIYMAELMGADISMIKK